MRENNLDSRAARTKAGREGAKPGKEEQRPYREWKGPKYFRPNPLVLV